MGGTSRSAFGSLAVPNPRSITHHTPRGSVFDAKKLKVQKNIHAKDANLDLESVKSIIAKARDARGTNPTASNLMKLAQNATKQMLAQ